MACSERGAIHTAERKSVESAREREREREGKVGSSPLWLTAPPYYRHRVCGGPPTFFSLDLLDIAGIEEPENLGNLDFSDSRTLRKNGDFIVSISSMARLLDGSFAVFSNKQSARKTRT